jgi:hypothetical protein
MPARNDIQTVEPGQIRETTRFIRRRLHRFTVLIKLHALHEARATHIAYTRTFLFQLGKPLTQLFPDPLGVLQQVVRLKKKSTVASAARGAREFSPNVETVVPSVESAISGVATVEPMGRPLAIPFAAVITSGCTCQCSMPNIFPPVRPKPVCTSSLIVTPP